MTATEITSRCVGQEPRFSLSQIGAHARLLMAIPLFFLCEAWLDPRMTAFVRAIVSSEVVPKTALPVLESEIARTVRWNNSWLPEAMSMLAAVLLSLIGPQMHLFGADLTPAISP